MNTTTTSADSIVRRRVAVEFLGKVMSVVDVALVMSVSGSNIKCWKNASPTGGTVALELKPNRGRPAMLSAAEKERLPRLLLDGPRKEP